MEYILYYFMVLFLTFIPVFIVTYVIPVKKNKLGIQGAFQFVVKKYNLSMNKKRVRLLSKVLVGINSFIISTALMIVLFVDIDRWLMYLISFIIFIVFMLIFYNLVGYILKKKGW